MSVAASTLLTAKTDLLEISLEKAREHHEKAVAGMAASMASGCATIVAIGETTGAVGAAAAAGGAGAATAGAATAGAATAGTATAGAAGAAVAGSGAVAAGGASAAAAGAGSAGAATAAAAAAETATAGAATAGAAGGAAIAAPVILGGLTIVAVYCAWNHFTQANDFDAECHRIKSGMFLCRSHHGMLTYN